MDLRGWDPGDQRVTRDNQRVDLHHYEGSWRGLKQTGVSTRRDRVNFGGNLRINGNIWRARSLESVKALGSLRLRKSSSNIIQRRDLCSTIVVLIKTKSQDLGVLLLKGCQKDTPQSFITRRWKSQLIGSAMSVERNPKRLKISGPHFDNTGLIDEVQFDFEEEEDIDEILYLVSLNQVQLQSRCCELQCANWSQDWAVRYSNVSLAIWRLPRQSQVRNLDLEKNYVLELLNGK
ncbi:hypothetical protein IGI04_020469, partial [Brassica rapa subsp. trilocularis]